MSTDSFTPSELVADEDFSTYTFEVPLYQRLFSWEKLEIDQLLSDLWKAYSKNPDEDYYIGIFTVVKNMDTKLLVLIDGQQRMTVLMLLGCALKNKNWQKFLHANNTEKKLRLSYFARPQDMSDLDNLIKTENPDKKDKIHNVNMKNFFECFNDFEIKKYKGVESEREGFSNYVFRHTRALISELPVSYSSNLQAQNQYFEKMNSSGQQLEPHEILKVRLRITDKNLAVWNSVSDFSNSIFSNKESGTPESNATSIETILGWEDVPKKDDKDIFQSKEPTETDKQNALLRDLIISFSTFLLHVLYQTLPEAETKCWDTKTWDTKNLIDTFDQYPHLNKEKFCENLLDFRKIMDRFIIHIADNDGRTSYKYWYEKQKQAEEFSGDVNLRQIQSMLYVSSDTNQKWLCPALKWLKDNEALKRLDDKIIDRFLVELEKQDNAGHPFEDLSKLSYPNIDRYWFWKLDYVLWKKFYGIKNKNEIEKIAADRYEFRTNRSIEHIFPQKPDAETNPALKVAWQDNKNIDSWGNLAMISAGTNSKLSNASVSKKIVHIKGKIQGTSQLTFESLKMVCAYEDCESNDDKWKPDIAEKHGIKMLEFLKNYYSEVENKNSTQPLTTPSVTG